MLEVAGLGSLMEMRLLWLLVPRVQQVARLSTWSPVRTHTHTTCTPCYTHTACHTYTHPACTQPAAQITQRENNALPAPVYMHSILTNMRSTDGLVLFLHRNRVQESLPVGYMCTCTMDPHHSWAFWS